MAQRGRATGSPTRDGQGGSERQGGQRRSGAQGRSDTGRRAPGAGSAGSGESAPRPRAVGGTDLGVVRTRVRAVAEPAAAAVGCDLEDLTVDRAGRRYVVRVVVDHDGGVDHDLISDLARALGKALDRAEQEAGEIFPGEYQLEISSPGVDRPLTEPRHWRRAVGRLVKVRVGTASVTARVMAADGSGVTLEEPDGQRREVPLTELGAGHVQLEFRRPGGDDPDPDDGDVADEAGLAEDDFEEFDDEHDEEGGE